MIFRKFISSYVSTRASRLKFLLVALCLTLGTTQAVFAHSDLVRSDPEDGRVLSESPTEVKAWFSHELDSNESMLQVSNSQSEQVDEGDGGVDLNDVEHALMVVDLPPTLPADTYTVSWTAVSAEDGDTTTGAFSFVVGNAQTGEAASLAGGSISGLNLGVIVIIILVAIFVLIFFIRYLASLGGNAPSDRPG